MQYISNIIDYVDVTFSYITNFADILDYNAKTRAEAVITIVDPDDNNKVIYKLKAKSQMLSVGKVKYYFLTGKK